MGPIRWNRGVIATAIVVGLLVPVVASAAEDVTRPPIIPQCPVCLPSGGPTTVTVTLSGVKDLPSYEHSYDPGCNCANVNKNYTLHYSRGCSWEFAEIKEDGQRIAMEPDPLCRHIVGFGLSRTSDFGNNNPWSNEFPWTLGIGNGPSVTLDGFSCRELGGKSTSIRLTKGMYSNHYLDSRHYRPCDFSDATVTVTGGAWEPVCGNGAVEAGEVCEPLNRVMSTTDSCTGRRECSRDCSSCTAVCGNGILQQGEECDDGYSIFSPITREGDGCSSTCTVERGWQCTLDPNYPSADHSTPRSICAPICGDGILARGSVDAFSVTTNEQEQCDDGNAESGDGCAEYCTGDCAIQGQFSYYGCTEPTPSCVRRCFIEKGWTCAGEPSVCKRIDDGSSSSSTSDTPVYGVSPGASPQVIVEIPATQGGWFSRTIRLPLRIAQWFLQWLK